MNKPSSSNNFLSVIALSCAILLLSACGSDDENPESSLAKLANAGALSAAVHNSSSSAAGASTAVVELSSGVVSRGVSSSTPLPSDALGSYSAPVTSPSPVISPAPVSAPVVANNRSSASSSSIGAMAETKDSTAPTAPARLKKAKLLSESVAFSWAAATDDRAVTGYRVYRNGTQVAQVSGNTFGYTDTKLQPDTVYNYTLRAGDAQGNWSPVSAALKVKTLIISGDVTIEWFVPTARENGDYLETAEIGGYEIRYKLSSQNNYTSVFVESGAADQYKLGYLEGDYEFQIATYDSNGLYSEFVAIKPN